MNKVGVCILLLSAITAFTLYYKAIEMAKNLGGVTNTPVGLLSLDQ